MSDLPTTPFPELHALDRKRPLPGLAELLGKSARLPVPPPSRPPGPGRHPRLDLPRFPAPAGDLPNAAPPSEPTLAELPVPEPPHEESMRETLAALMDEELDPPPGAAPATAPPPSARDARTTSREDLGEPPAATDADLVNAFQPLVETSLARAFTSTETGLHAFLEPMLRCTVRRAIAEQLEISRQFKQLGAFDRLGLRLLSLLTSRSYEDLLFTRTRRYQVEELYLLQRRSNALVSYASHDPARHVSTRRILPTVRLLASKLTAPDGSIESSFDLPDRRLALVREGQYCLLVACLRGRSNALVRADLDYLLRQVEDRFGARLEERNDAFLPVLQPLLEGGLLIQSPAPPR